MFENFKLEMIELPEATLRVRYGGSGLPLLLLHGHPRTHTTWHKVAPLLARSFTVVCPDLRGFGKSSKPEPVPSTMKLLRREQKLAIASHSWIALGSINFIWPVMTGEAIQPFGLPWIIPLES